MLDSLRSEIAVALNELPYCQLVTCIHKKTNGLVRPRWSG
ncbi:hypothetical protein DSUL_50072 [Desulfovibrionales bacterium]